MDIETEDVCPQLDLPSTWSEYLASLDRKDRHELRRKLRKLGQAGEVELETVEEPAAVVAALDDFLRLYRESRSDKAAFMTEQMERFFRAIISALAAEGKVELIFLNLGGVRAAAVLCFCAGEESLLYNSGYDPNYAYLSVGVVRVVAALDDFLRLYRESRSDKAAFMTEQMERFFRAIISALAAEGKVELIFLNLGGVRAAAVLCFCAGEESLLYNNGYDPNYAYLSVGLLSKALALRKAIEEGKRRFDFLRGHEPYKYDLGAKDVSVYRCTVRRN